MGRDQWAYFDTFLLLDSRWPLDCWDSVLGQFNKMFNHCLPLRAFAASVTLTSILWGWIDTFNEAGTLLDEAILFVVFSVGVSSRGRSRTMTDHNVEQLHSQTWFTSVIGLFANHVFNGTPNLKGWKSLWFNSKTSGPAWPQFSMFLWRNY